jgi:hypothetical protein
MYLKAVFRSAGCLAALILLAAVPACCGDLATPFAVAKDTVIQHPHWAASAVMSLTASMVDGAGSAYILDDRKVPGVGEMNPIIVRLNGGNSRMFAFGGFGFKAGTWAAQATIQTWFLHKYTGSNSRKLARIYTIANWAVAGFYTGCAIHNSRYIIR